MCIIDDKLWAYHCGPVLMNKKPAALFSVEGGPEIRVDFDGVWVMPCRKNPRRTLLFVYRPKLLAMALGCDMARRTLARLGYPMGAGLDGILAHLRRRIQNSRDFPHEIGFFLGYPPADVIGFMLHGGQKCKHLCMWKVYGDVEKAKKLCGEYEECRKLCCAHVETGGDLRSLPVLVQTAG